MVFDQPYSFYLIIVYWHNFSLFTSENCFRRVVSISAVFVQIYNILDVRRCFLKCSLTIIINNSTVFNISLFPEFRSASNLLVEHWYHRAVVSEERAESPYTVISQAYWPPRPTMFLLMLQHSCYYYSVSFKSIVVVGGSYFLCDCFFVEVICGKCSSHKAPLIYNENVVSRVCDTCFVILSPMDPRHSKTLQSQASVRSQQQQPQHQLQHKKPPVILQVIIRFE